MKEHDFVSKDGTVETTIYYLDCGHRSLSADCPHCKLDRRQQLLRRIWHDLRDRAALNNSEAVELSASIYEQLEEALSDE